MVSVTDYHDQLQQNADSSILDITGALANALVANKDDMKRKDAVGAIATFVANDVEDKEP